MADESSAMVDRLREDLAQGDTLRAAQRFVDSLGGPGAWERRTAEQRQIMLDNIATGPACAERPRFARDELARLPGPMMLVTGARSPRRYASMLVEMQRLNAGVRDLVTIPEAAHAMNRENPVAFNSAVLTVLQHDAGCSCVAGHAAMRRRRANRCRGDRARSVAARR